MKNLKYLFILACCFFNPIKAEIDPMDRIALTVFSKIVNDLGNIIVEPEDNNNVKNNVMDIFSNVAFMISAIIQDTQTKKYRSEDDSEEEKQYTADLENLFNLVVSLMDKIEKNDPSKDKSYNNKISLKKDFKNLTNEDGVNTKYIEDLLIFTDKLVKKNEEKNINNQIAAEYHIEMRLPEETQE